MLVGAHSVRPRAPIMGLGKFVEPSLRAGRGEGKGETHRKRHLRAA